MRRDHKAKFVVLTPDCRLAHHTPWLPMHIGKFSCSSRLGRWGSGGSNERGKLIKKLMQTELYSPKLP
jgi:hypothetical protein